MMMVFIHYAKQQPRGTPPYSASISAGLDRESLFPGGAAGGRCGTGFPAARRRFHRAYGNAGFEVQAIRIAQQLFDAHLRDSPLQQVAHRRLVLIQQVHQLRLRVLTNSHLKVREPAKIKGQKALSAFCPLSSQNVPDFGQFSPIQPQRGP